MKKIIEYYQSSCSNCNGKGHVLDGSLAALAVLSVGFIVPLILDRNNRHGLAREKCQNCKGTGKIEMKRIIHEISN